MLEDVVLLMKNLVFKVIDGREGKTAQLVIAFKQPVGDSKHLTARVAPKSGQPHRHAIKEKYRISEERERRRCQEQEGKKAAMTKSTAASTSASAPS